MLLKMGSLLLVLLIVSYCIFHFHRNKEKMSKSIEWASSLVTGVSAAVFSFLLIQVSNFNLILTIVGALLFTLVSGFLSKSLFPEQNGVNEWLSGLVGTTLGATFGYMMFLSTKPILILDVVFILFIYLLLTFFDRQLKEDSKRKTGKKNIKQSSNVSTIMLSTLLVIVLLVIGINIKQIKMGVIGQPQNQTAAIEQDNNLQVATIHVTRAGIEPKNTTLKAYTMLKLIFDVEKELGNNIKFVSNDLKINADLKSGKNTILLDDPQAGNYTYTIQPGNYSGTITVRPSK